MEGKPSILEADGIRLQTPAAWSARHRVLIGQALIALLAVGWATLRAARFASRQLHFSGAYPSRSLLVFAAGALLMLPGLPAHHPYGRLGAANAVTLVRGALVALLAALVGEQAAGASLVATVIATSVIALDGCDGWLARRTRMTSAFGARFDMEIDAALVAVLAVLAWQFGKVAAWVLLSGAMRYLFAAAALCVPLLRRPLPPSYRAKSIAVVQMFVLVIAIAPWSSATFASGVAAIGLACLTLSFLLDILWQARHPVRP